MIHIHIKLITLFYLSDETARKRKNRVKIIEMLK